MTRSVQSVRWNQREIHKEHAAVESVAESVAAAITTGKQRLPERAGVALSLFVRDAGGASA